MATGKGTTTADFGTGKTDVFVDVAVPAITTESVEAWIVPAVTASNTVDNHWVEDLQVVAGQADSGVGFRIYLKCRTGVAHGVYNLGYVYA